jgi:chromosome segregation ATPase
VWRRRTEHAEARIEELEAERDKARQEVIDLAWSEGKLQERIEALAAQLVEMESWSSEVINQWGDPFEPRAEWEAHVADAMRGLGKSADSARALLARMGD